MTVLHILLILCQIDFLNAQIIEFKYISFPLVKDFEFILNMVLLAVHVLMIYFESVNYLFSFPDRFFFTSYCTCHRQGSMTVLYLIYFIRVVLETGT